LCHTGIIYQYQERFLFQLREKKGGGIHVTESLTGLETSRAPGKTSGG
jgi:hypothetical protein